MYIYHYLSPSYNPSLWLAILRWLQYGICKEKIWNKFKFPYPLAGQLLLRENLTRVRHILAEPPFGVLKPARRGRTLLESESRAVTAAVSLAYSSQVRRTFIHTYMLGHPHTLPTTCVPYTYYYTYYTYTLY